MRTMIDGSSLEGRAREDYVKSVFDRIAGPYDRLNRIISLGRDMAWRRRALELARLEPGAAAVDLGTGTGDLFVMLASGTGAGGRVVGVDLSESMLEQARRKAGEAAITGPHELRVGSAEATGLEDAGFDVATMGWVLRNVGSRERSYAEILRILKPGGRLAVIETSRPGFAPVRWLSAIYMRTLMPLLVRLGGGDRNAYDYLTRSTARFPLKRELADEMGRAGFESVTWESKMFGSIAIHLAHKPRD